MKVVILGAGIGGLTVAHELSKFKDLEIHIYEMKNEIGGLARSSRTKDGCPTEYCWRVFFGFYHNLLKTMSEIPTPQGCVRDNITTYNHVNIEDTPLSLRDKLALYYQIIYGVTSCDERLDDLDNVSWWESLETASDSNLFREIGGWLGMDRYKGSYNSVIRIGMEQQILQSMVDQSYRDYVTTQPTSEAWFDHWQLFLQSRGVKFHFNSTVTDILISNDQIKTVEINSVHKITADTFVLSLPVNAFSDIIRYSSSSQILTKVYPNILTLNETCMHHQLSFQLYFDRPVSLGEEKNAFLVVDSPWDVIVLSYDRIYTESICTNNNKVKGAWSVAACTSYVPGILYNKSMDECTYSEIISELWAQLYSSQKLRELVKNSNPFELHENIIVKWAPMWGTYTRKDEKLVTSEPKFTNNVGSKALRPSCITPFKNLYIAAAYTREAIDIYSMEGANISGKTVAHLIRKNSPCPIDHPRPFWLAPFRAVDVVLWKLGLPNVVIPLLLIAIIIFIVKKTST